MINKNILLRYTLNYLGNNRALINGSTGPTEQTVAYYPFGAVIADLGTPTTGQPYKFGGKELLTTNGLNEYDFGARNYYSAVPGFTKPDPMAEKYYWLSPYLYCANNPVNFIDPTGMDTWTLDSDGHIVSHVEHSEYDEVIIDSGNNEENKNWRKEYGSIKSHSTNTSASGIDYTVIEAVNDETGTSLFEFLADNIAVEWSQIKTGDDKNSSNFITTSHMETEEYSAEIFIKANLKGINIRTDIHSHPRGSNFPSGMDSGPNWRGDIRYAKWLSLFAPSDPNFYIYIPSEHEYIQYNPNSQKSDFPIFHEEIPEIIVFGKK